MGEDGIELCFEDQEQPVFYALYDPETPCDSAKNDPYRRPATKNRQLAADCAAYFIKTGELYPGAYWAKYYKELKVNFIHKKYRRGPPAIEGPAPFLHFSPDCISANSPGTAPTMTVSASGKSTSATLEVEYPGETTATSTVICSKI